MRSFWKRPPDLSPDCENMTLQMEHAPAPAGGESSGVPAVMLDNLAARFRSCGLFVVLIQSNGSIVYHDPQAAMFFQRYVLPLLQYGDPTEPDFREKLRKVDADSPVAVWNNLPGVILAALPCVDRRQLCGVLVLAGQVPGF